MSNISDTRFACQVTDYMATAIGNKMYITGGYNLVCNATASGCFNGTATGNPIANNDLLTIDFTKQFTWDPNRVGTRTRMPAQVADVRWGTLWGVDGKLYQFGGDANGHSAEDLFGAPAPTPRPSVGTSVWEYDISTTKWEEAHPQTEWEGVMEPVAHGASACGGGDVCYLLLGQTEMKYNGSLLAYNVKDRKWLDMSGVRGFIERLYGAQMVYVEALDMLVVIGGAFVNSTLHRQMSTVSLFYIPTKTWFTVQASAPPGWMPNTRLDFCAAAVSAEDGSSHNIYIFGGSGDLNPTRPPPPPSATANTNVWVLSLPGFFYIHVGETTPGREGLSCAIIDKKYLVTFSGHSRRLEPKLCDTSPFQGVMWDVSKDSWTGLYRPPVGTEKPLYKVPPRVFSVIGGNQTGGANQAKPEEGFLDLELKSIFERQMGGPTGVPKDSEGPTGDLEENAVTTGTPKEAGKTTPTGSIAGGVVGGVAAVVVIILVVWWIQRRRSRSRRPGAVDLAELYNGSVMGEEMPTHGKVETPAAQSPRELESRQKYEVMGSEPAVEMEGSTMEIDETRPPR